MSITTIITQKEDCEFFYNVECTKPIKNIIIFEFQFIKICFFKIILLHFSFLSFSFRMYCFNDGIFFSVKSFSSKKCPIAKYGSAKNFEKWTDVVFYLK